MESLKLSQIWSYNPIPKVESLPGKIPVSNKSIVFGLELELEKVQYKSHVMTIPATWIVTDDGSLKLDGVEFISIPLKQLYLETELKRLYDGLENFKSTLRCSTHVHMNVRDFTLKELAGFVLLYQVFEKSFFKYVGLERWDNFFCVPLFEIPTIVGNALKCMESNQPSMTWKKYSALNLCPIWGGDGSKTLGTVEFRHMRGTGDIESIINWVNLIARLKLAAKKMPLEEIKDHIKVMNTTSGYYWLVTEVFGQWASLLTDQPTFKEDVESCIARAKFAITKL